MKKPYKLLVSGLGTVYIAKILATPGIMSQDRHIVPDEEFLLAIEQFASMRIKKGHDTLEIKDQDGVVKLEIRLPRNQGEKPIKYETQRTR